MGWRGDAKRNYRDGRPFLLIFHSIISKWMVHAEGALAVRKETELL